MATSISSRVRGGAAIVELLKAHGVDTVFGIPGVHNLDIYDALHENPGITNILARHEQGAGFMADGYYRATGKPELPVQGVVLTGFGETDSIGAKSQGLSVEAPPGALVVAPMGGRIKFAGTFKNYGKMIIIEHESGYYSLIGGLGGISAAVDQAVRPGEPIGKLPGASSRGASPVLYYELRHKGQAIDPSRKFANLKS